MSEPIAWPEEFGTRFVVFVDVEEEFDWDSPLSRDNRSVDTVAALPQAHARFAAAGVPLALMVDHPVASDAQAVDLIGPLLTGGSVVGAQLHPWVNPPFDESLTPRNSFAGNLPRAVEATKLDALTDAITTAFEVRPTAYRAGAMASARTRSNYWPSADTGSTARCDRGSITGMRAAPISRPRTIERFERAA